MTHRVNADLDKTPDTRALQPLGSASPGPPTVDPAALLDVVLGLQRGIRAVVLEACATQSAAELSGVAADGPGDTIYRIDRVTEELLLSLLEPAASALGGIVLVAEGLPGGEVTLSNSAKPAALRFIVDPIDGTRGLMYQKRSAWVLSAVALNRGANTRLSDVIVAAQTELPLLKQHLCDEVWAVRGAGAHAQRVQRFTGQAQPLHLQPSRAGDLRHGFAMLTRFFPGAKDELAAIEEETLFAVMGPAPAGKALCFEDQYASTGGQLYELMAGRDRFNADLRPLMNPLLKRRGLATGLCCHPYDVCNALIAQELGVVLTDAWGNTLDAPLNVEADVAWVGYANEQLRQLVEPPLQAALQRRGLTPEQFPELC